MPRFPKKSKQNTTFSPVPPSTVLTDNESVKFKNTLVVGEEKLVEEMEKRAFRLLKRQEFQYGVNYTFSDGDSVLFLVTLHFNKKGMTTKITFHADCPREIMAAFEERPLTKTPLFTKPPRT